MPEHTENHDLITTAQEAVTPYPVDHTTTGLFIVRTGSGDPYVVDLRDHLGCLPDRPWRKTGELTLTDPDSFIAALNKHGLPQTELYGDTKRGAIRAVINAPPSPDPPHPTPGHPVRGGREQARRPPRTTRPGRTPAP